MIIILLILAVLLVIFTLQNQVDLTIQFFFWKIEDAPFVLIILSCFLLGYLLSSVYLYPKLWKTRRKLKKQMRANSESQKVHETAPASDNNDSSNPEGIKLDDDAEDVPFFYD